MTLFIWPYVEQVSSSYHSNGGVVALAETEARARELANAQVGCYVQDTEQPTVVGEVSGAEEGVWIFPNAGCC